ncbi:MAG: efflux RND transporter periplasmic adaptor subunit [Deltaproteobacteria bacterium]|nr:efflux RND transporter periplasmic adaptor subunit [Deltaproteobacteria bacterium]
MSEHEGHELPEGQEPPPPGFRLMAVVRWLIVLAMAIVAAAAIVYGFELRGKPAASASAEVYYCPMHPSVVQDHPGECPICGMDLVKREGADGGTSQAADAGKSHEGHRHNPADPYACPMDPEETGLSDKDRCPVCKMRLEPRQTIDAGPAASAKPGSSGAPGVAVAPSPVPTNVPGLAPIELSLDRVQLIGMKTAKVSKESLVPEIRTIGFVTAPESGVVKVTTRYGGFIERVVVAETGRKVKRGELLAVVYSPQIYLAEQEYLTARSLGAGGVGVDLSGDAKKRLELLGVPPGEIAAVEKDGKPHKYLGVSAPTSGWIVQKNAIQGLSFQAGADLFTIADLSKIWVLADVYEGELPRVRVGQKATAALAAVPDHVLTGEVKLVYPSVDPATRTAKVRLEFDNATLDLKPGMYASVGIALPPSSGVVIPREALVDTGDIQYVFVDKGAGKFEPRRVSVGIKTGEKVEIRSGVEGGETVVTTGNFLLDSESRLRAAIEGPGAQQPAAPPPSACETEFDKAKFPEKHAQCLACEKQHAGMGKMVDDCKAVIAKPWR